MKYNNSYIKLLEKRANFLDIDLKDIDKNLSITLMYNDYLVYPSYKNISLTVLLLFIDRILIML